MIAALKSKSSGIGQEIVFLIMIGKGGQMRVSSTRVPGPQTSLKSRKFGDAKTTERHRRET
jgi:hypothetical protein